MKKKILLTILLTSISLHLASEESTIWKADAYETTKEILKQTPKKIIKAGSFIKNKTKAIVNSTIENLPDKTPRADHDSWFKRHFSFAPNSIVLAPFSYSYIDSNGIFKYDSYKTLNPFKTSFTIFSYLSITKAYYPYHPWTWELKFTPTYTYFKWDEIGNIKFFQASLGPKLIFHLPEGYGSIKLAAGLGPLIVSGKIKSAEEHNKLTLAPLVQLAYYKYLNDILFLKLEYSTTYLLSDIFVSQNPAQDNMSSMESFSSFQFNFGLTIF